jgi:hypothetical protein
MLRTMSSYWEKLNMHVCTTSWNNMHNSYQIQDIVYLYLCIDIFLFKVCILYYTHRWLLTNESKDLEGEFLLSNLNFYDKNLSIKCIKEKTDWQHMVGWWWSTVLVLHIQILLHYLSVFHYYPLWIIYYAVVKGCWQVECLLNLTII